MYVRNRSQPNTRTKSSRSILAWRYSVSVRDFEAKAMGLPSWIRAAPKPLDDASTCIMDFLEGS